MSDRDAKTVIKDVILEINEDLEITDETLLLEEEVLDSLTILYLVSELEREYEIQIPVEDVVEENFRTINSLSDYINKKIENS